MQSRFAFRADITRIDGDPFTAVGTEVILFRYIWKKFDRTFQHLYGETVSWSLAIASTAQLAIGRGSTPLGDTTFLYPLSVYNFFALSLLCLRILRITDEKQFTTQAL